MRMRMEYGLACLGTALAASMIVFATAGAFAADLGGNCCADLEERIAELEATAAKKGNRKVSLTVSGSVNQAVIAWDDGLLGPADARVIANSTSDTYLRVSGAGRAGNGWKAGFVLELGLGGWDVLTDAASINDSIDVYTREANGWVEGPMGKLTLGRARQATDGVVEQSWANVAPATRMLSFRPLVGGDGITENLDLFDGQRLNLLRYDSPTFAGFTVSASWSRDGTPLAGAAVNDVWDAALRYAGEFGQFKAAGAVGYRNGAVFPGLAPILPLPVVAFDQKTLSGSASLMHMPTGFFVNLAAGRAEFAGGGEVTSWEVMPGIEEKWSTLGKTTLYGEYASFDIKGASDPVVYWGGGVVQAVDGAGLSAYVSARHIDPGVGAGTDLTYGMFGLKLDF